MQCKNSRDGWISYWLLQSVDYRNCENATEALHKFTTVTGHTAGAIQSYCWRYSKIMDDAIGAEQK